MNIRIKNVHGALLGTALLATVATPAWADPDEIEGESALKLGTYFSPMAEFAMNAGRSEIKNPLGGLFAVGFRESFYSIEAGFIYSSSKPLSNTGPTVTQTGGMLNALIFPTSRVPGLYGLVGGGELAVRSYPGNGNASFSVTNFQGGLGYLQKIRIGSYQFALRAEAAYRYGFRENGQATNEFRVDTDAPRQFHDVVIRAGLVLPIDISHWLHLDRDAPVKVVPVESGPVVVAPNAAPAPAPQDGNAPAQPSNDKPDDLDFLKDSPPASSPPPAQDNH